MKLARESVAANPPLCRIIHSHSAPTTEAAPAWIHTGKRIKARKRHIVTDTEGFALAVRP